MGWSSWGNIGIADNKSRGVVKFSLVLKKFFDQLVVHSNTYFVLEYTKPC